MLKNLIVAQVVVLVLTIATTAAAQVSCEDSILITGLELRLNAAKARHKGCLAREKYVFDQDPYAYQNANGSGRQMCNSVFTIYAACESTAANECQAREALSTAQNDCRNLQSEELELTKDAVDELNDLRPGGGANTISKELTQDALESLAGTSRTTLGGLDRVTGEANEAFSDSGGSLTTGSSDAQTGSQGEIGGSAIGLDVELSPEFQAILDGSVEALRQANRDNDLSIDEAQRILNNGLQQIEEQTQRDIDQARDEIFGNQTGSANESDLETRMRQQFDELRPKPRTSPTATRNSEVGDRRSNVGIMSCGEAHILQRRIGWQELQRRYFGHISENAWRSCGGHSVQPWEVLCGAFDDINVCMRRFR